MDSNILKISSFTKLNEKYTNLDSIQYSTGTPTLTYIIKDGNSSANKISYTPVVNSQAGLTVTKDSYSIGASFEDPAQNKDTKNFGRSHFFDLQLNTIYKRES